MLAVDDQYIYIQINYSQYIKNTSTVSIPYNYIYKSCVHLRCTKQVCMTLFDSTTRRGFQVKYLRHIIDSIKDPQYLSYPLPWRLTCCTFSRAIQDRKLKPVSCITINFIKRTRNKHNELNQLPCSLIPSFVHE
jgi:hypothetical protein